LERGLHLHLALAARKRTEPFAILSLLNSGRDGYGGKISPRFGGLLCEPPLTAVAQGVGAGHRGEPLAEVLKQGRQRRKRVFRVVQIALSLGVVLGVFFGILPRIADYSVVWATIRTLTWFELMSLLAITTLHSMALWPQLTASLPGLSVAQAAVNSQAATTVANTLPGGGVLSVGVTYAMCRSWGFADPAIALSALITFVWNTFFKLALPVVALALLAAQGKGSGGLILVSLVGIAVLVGSLALVVSMRWRTALAGQVGSVLGAVASFLRKLIRKPPVGDWAEAVVRFRGEAGRLVADRWIALTLSTVTSHLGLPSSAFSPRSRSPLGALESSSLDRSPAWSLLAGIKPTCRWPCSTPRSPPRSSSSGPSRTASSFRTGHWPT
jgi:hypothetical protein